MTYMTKRQLVKAYNSGHLDDVRKQVCNYGTIQETKDWEIEDKGSVHYGCHRRYTIQHHGLLWTIRMHNGEVNGVGYTA